MLTAPPGWAYALFPLAGTDDATLDIECVARHGNGLITEAARVQDEAGFGPVMHWAHILKTAQGPDGTWPAVVDARTGQAIGTARTLAPAALMARLDALLNSSEYADAVEAAAQAAAQGEQDGRRERDHHTEC